MPQKVYGSGVKPDADHHLVDDDLLNFMSTAELLGRYVDCSLAQEHYELNDEQASDAALTTLILLPEI